MMRSLNYPVRSRQYVGRNDEADLLCGFEIDHQLKCRRLLNGQVGRVGSFQYLVNIHRGTMIEIADQWPICEQPAFFRELPRRIHAWEAMLQRELHDLFGVKSHERI